MTALLAKTREQGTNSAVGMAGRREQLPAGPTLSIIVPLRDAEATALPLLQEIQEAMGSRSDYEVICVDDGSSDGTVARLLAAQKQLSKLRCYGFAEARGYETATHHGVLLAKGAFVLTLIGGGCGDPADIPVLLSSLLGARRVAPVAMIVGVPTTEATSRQIFDYVSRNISRFLSKASQHRSACMEICSRAAYLRLARSEGLCCALPNLMQCHGYHVLVMPVGRRPGQSTQPNRAVWSKLWPMRSTAWTTRALVDGVRPGYQPPPT